MCGFAFVEYGWGIGINVRRERPMKAGISAAVVCPLFRTEDRGDCNVLVEKSSVQHHYDGQEGEDDAVPEVKKITSGHRWQAIEGYWRCRNQDISSIPSTLSL